MKKIVFFLLIWLPTVAGVRGQAFDIEQLLLDVQKLEQLKEILQDLKNGYQVLQSGYSAIRDIAHGSFNLHKTYLDGLLAVSPTVRGYERIAAIASLQAQLVRQYQSAWGRFTQDVHLQPAELVVIGQSFTGILAASARDLDDLLTVVTAGVLRASDAERLELVDAIYYRLHGRVAAFNNISNETTLLSLQRSAEGGDIAALRRWFGLNP